MIEFLEHHSERYPPRTYENAGADATIAFAFDFETSGERLTRKYVQVQKKLYFRVDLFIFTDSDIKEIIDQLIKHKVKTLNVAGNSMKTIAAIAKRRKCTWDQELIDGVIYRFFAKSIRVYGLELDQIRSGGQSGADEAGLKAAIAHGIPAFCLAPKGWPFLTPEGKTIRNEQLFKARFKAA